MQAILTKYLLDESPDAVIATTVEGKMLYWSKGAEAVFGYTGAEAVGHIVNGIIVPPDLAEEERRIQEDALQQGLAVYESVRWRKGGLLVDGPGSGKTIFALQFLMHGAQNCKEPGTSGAIPASDRQRK